MRRLIVIAVLLLAVPAFGSGGNFCIPGQTATDYSGGCSGGGTSWGTTVPLCTNDADGTFILHSVLPNFCATAAITMTKVQFKQLTGPTATGTNCNEVEFASYTDNSDGDEADITWGTKSTQATKDLTTCNTATGTGICWSGAAGVVTSEDVATGIDCVTTACNEAPLKVRITSQTGAECTSGSADDIEIIQACFSCP